MHQSIPKRWVSQNYSKRGKKSSQNTHKKRPIDLGSKRDRDLKDKAAEKRCRSQPRDRGKVAGKKVEISKK